MGNIEVPVNDFETQNLEFSNFKVKYCCFVYNSALRHDFSELKSQIDVRTKIILNLCMYHTHANENTMYAIDIESLWLLSMKIICESSFN